MAYQQPQQHYGYGQYTQQHQWMPLHNTGPLSNEDVYKPAATTQTFEVEDEATPAYRKQSFMQKYLGGLKRTLRAFAFGACVILAINLGWLLHAKGKYGIVDGYGTIREGNCADVKKLNTWLHLAINVLSTLLLTGSNAFMAAYSGPTRLEIDKAHARRRWLHVGCVSLRNLFGISWRKSLVVCVLALSSVPFHLLYNSLIFTSLASNNYYWAVVTEDFSKGGPYNLTGPAQWALYDTNHTGSQIFTVEATFPDDSSEWRIALDNPDEMAPLESMYAYFDSMQTKASSWERLDQAACIKAYSNVFISDRRNVLLVSSTSNQTDSVLTYGSSDIDSGLDSNWWICSEGGNDGGEMTCKTQDYLAKASTWEVYGYPIEYCLSEPLENICSVKFSLTIMYVVVVFNSLKVAAMLWVVLRLDAQHILACAGDAAASFIMQPDQTTVNMCLAERKEIDKYWKVPIARLYNNAFRRRWGRTISKKRWLLFYAVILLSWAAVTFFGIWGFLHTRNKGIPLTLSGLYSLGFGTINQNAIVFADNDLNALVTSIIANIPQVFLALIYLNYMGLMTTMFHAVDWSKFATQPQTLMVSTPSGEQRGTWLLGAPLVYGIGLSALQTLLHWFISQSLFMVQITVYDKQGNVDRMEYGGAQISNCGYSPIAIICSLVISGILVLTAMFFMLRRLPAGSPPIVSSCSAAISAACHVPMAMVKDATVYEKLRWGVSAMYPNGVGHCSLAPADAWEHGYSGPPVAGRPYAGLGERVGTR